LHVCAGDLFHYTATVMNRYQLLVNDDTWNRHIRHLPKPYLILAGYLYDLRGFYAMEATRINATQGGQVEDKLYTNYQESFMLAAFAANKIGGVRVIRNFATKKRESRAQSIQSSSKRRRTVASQSKFSLS
jgi:hypothetical protein